MPVIQKKYIHDYSSLTKYTLSTYTATKGSGGTETNSGICKEITTDFYTELKELLRETNPDDFVFNDSTYSFTIWGRQYDVLCQFLSTGSSSLIVLNTGYANVIAPIIFSKNCISSVKCFRWMSLNSSNITAANVIGYTVPGSGANTNMFTSSTDKVNTSYSIKVYYNTNYYCIQYFSAYGEVINLLTIIKGYLTDNDTVGVLYECPSPNNNYFETADINNYLLNLAQGSVYGTVPTPTVTSAWNCGYHQIYRMDNDDTILPLPTSGMSGSSNNLSYFGLQHASMCMGKTNITELATTTDTIITQPLCLGGLITFDNMLLGDGSLNINSFYTINGGTYYCCGDDIQKGNEATFDRLFLYPRFLLKL